jgi:hypothetical protein
LILFIDFSHMIESNTTVPPERVRVSIFERIVPFAALALAAIGGAAGGWSIISLMNTLRAVENAGIAAVAGGLAEYTWFPLGFLYAAAALGVVAICVAIGRLVVETKTASPSGVSYLVLGLLSLVPLAFVWQAGSLIISVIGGTASGEPGEWGERVAAYCVYALIATPIVLVILLAWSLIPFKAKPGRRFGPIVALVVMEIALVAVAVMFQLRVAELWRINMAS